jgi:hypothetical protein
MRRETLVLKHSGGDIQRGEQPRRAMALVVVRHRPRAPCLHRQAGLRAIQRLNLTLLIERKAHRSHGGRR